MTDLIWNGLFTRTIVWITDIEIGLVIIYESDRNYQQSRNRLTLTLPSPSAGVSGSLDSYCSLKPLCSGMVEVVPARTSPTLLPHPLALCCHYPVSKCCSASIVMTGTVRVNSDRVTSYIPELLLSCFA